jgi:hypothetical protein
MAVPKKKSKASSAGRKGWATRRAKAEALEKKKAAEARARKARKREKEEAHRRHVEAGKKGYKKRLAKERTRAALDTWLENAGQRDARGEFVRETRVLHAQWLRAKDELLRAVGDDYDEYMAILDELAEETGTEWDIAYASSTEAA